MKRGDLGFLFVVSAFVLQACSEQPNPGAPRTSNSTVPQPNVSTSSGAAKVPKPEEVKPPATKFLRARPDSTERNGVDACAYLGGFGFACLDALIAEKNPIIKRYMRRLSDADARQAFDRWQKKDPAGVPHAEFSDQCADKGACKGTADKNDDGYACLTRAEMAIQENNEKESKAAHERACNCGAERAQIPISGGFLACQGKIAEKRGQNLTTAEADEVRACAECDGEKGPASCAKEIERLSKSDAELAKYIETVHVPRCGQP